MAGFTLSGGFHFDPTGEAPTPAGITARGLGGMTFTPPPPPPPSYEAYTYQAIEQIYMRSDTISTNSTDTTTRTDLQENDVMIVSANGYTSTNIPPVPEGWTAIEGAAISASAVPGYGVSHNAYYKVCDDSDSHDFEVIGVSDSNTVFTYVALRNLRVTGGPNTSPIGDVKTRSGTSENYAATDLDVFNTTSTVDDDTSWVMYIGQYEFGHRTIYGRGSGGPITQYAYGGGMGGSKYIRTIVKGQTEDLDAYSRYISNPTVYYGGSPKTPRYIGISIELVARPTHTGGQWPSSLEQPE